MAIPGWLRAMAMPLFVFLFSRGGIFVIAFLSLILIPVNDPLTHSTTVQYAKADNLWTYAWGPWWDAGWYSQIATTGYTNAPNGIGARDTVFFPLYPLTVKAVSLLVPNHLLAGALASNAFFCMALVILYKLVAIRSDGRLARRTIVALAVFPTAFFYSAIFTESLFLLTGVSAFYFGERKKWAWAALMAALASATRSSGIFVVVGLVIVYLEQIEFQWRRIRYDILYLPLGFLGLIGYMVFLAVRFGSPWLFITNQDAPGWAGWDRANILGRIQATIQTAIWPPQNSLSGSFDAMGVLNLTAFAFAILLLFAGAMRYFVSWRRDRRRGLPGGSAQPLRLGWLVWGALVVLISIPAWFSMGRYVVTVFPIFLVLATYLERQEAFWGYVYLSTLLLALYTILYTHHFWVA